jgi:hypothetical protein
MEPDVLRNRQRIEQRGTWNTMPMWSASRRRSTSIAHAVDENGASSGRSGPSVGGHQTCPPLAQTDAHIYPSHGETKILQTT